MVHASPSFKASSGFGDMDDDIPFDSVEVPAFLIRQPRQPTKASTVTPLELLEAFDATAQSAGAEATFAGRLDALSVSPELTALLGELTRQLGSRAQAWGVLLQWLADALKDEFSVSRHGTRILRHVLKPVDAASLASLMRQVTARLGNVTSRVWATALGVL